METSASGRNRLGWVVVAALTGVFLAPAHGEDHAGPKGKAELANMVIQDCGSCHGLKLRGGLGPPLRPGDLEHLPEAAVAAIIREGVPGTAMPPWKALLSAEEIRWISEQLKSGSLITPE
ncbi:c-type cytochrome [Marinobacter sp.]|uniref:c-type cytochrome n=1 Tax=Marinobacter sp. TaxID=50741 RepID=UPI0035624E7A